MGSLRFHANGRRGRLYGLRSDRQGSHRADGFDQMEDGAPCPQAPLLLDRVPQWRELRALIAVGLRESTNMPRIDWVCRLTTKRAAPVKSSRERRSDWPRLPKSILSASASYSGSKPALGENGDTERSH